MLSRAGNAPVEPVLDRDLKIAVDALNRSTTAILKQTESLKAQQDAVAKLLRTTESDEQTRGDLENAQAYRSEKERLQLAATVSGLEALSLTLYSP